MAVTPAIAGAATLSGTFYIDIYSYNAGGTQSNADATLANLNTLAGPKVDSVVWTGALDFRIGSGNSATTTIADFFASGTGTVSGLDAGVGGLTLSLPTFQNTTMFDIRGTFLSGFTATVTHDDGFTAYRDGVELVPASPAPTTEKNTALNFGGPGELRLIYVAANGNPSILEVTGENLPSAVPIPLPAAGWLLIGGIGALVAVRRRKKAAA
jgi:hypothetical protein